MADEDTEFSNFLAYTKSPKTAKRTSFQNELQKAINARVLRQKAVDEKDYSDYSEEFESDDSLDDSYNRTNTTESKTNKPLYDFETSDEDDFPKTLSFIKNKKEFASKNDKGIEDKRITTGRNSGDHDNVLLKSLLFDDGKKEVEVLEDTKSRPVPKPRENKMNATLTKGSSLPLSNETLKPTPQLRNLLRRGDDPDGNDSTQTEDWYKKPSSVSAPSSFTRLNETISFSDMPVFSEGNRLPSSSSILSKSKTFPLLGNESNESRGTFSKESPNNLLKDLNLKEINVNEEKSESQVSGKHSPSVLEMMLSSVKEKSNQRENNTFNESRPASENGIQKITEDKNAEGASSPSIRSLASMQNGKKIKSGTHIVAKSRYLGTLMVLDTSQKQISSNAVAEDSLRAAVYQTWQEKKKSFLHEQQKLKKTKEEQEKEKQRKEEMNKMEEAKAAFYAWKAEKSKEMKKHVIEQRQSAGKKMKEIQELAYKKDESKKAFEQWKKEKELHLKEKIRKQKQAELEKKNVEQKFVHEKKKENIQAVEAWSKRKEHVLEEKKKEKVHEKLKHEKIKSEKQDKDKKALEVYEEWLEKKERRERIEKKQKRLYLILDDEPPPPWSPPGRTIPSRK
ncbi:microtubule-associated protein 9 [Bombina bombina]|uniref:microtubule-associated protein 9 n=1 Tax=Bombina bombina TaxID=8345 RepID=UPI00235A76FC|nr:microtubule-associated protein 9 [Bombina bombina]